MRGARGEGRGGAGKEGLASAGPDGFNLAQRSSFRISRNGVSVVNPNPRQRSEDEPFRRLHLNCDDRVDLI